MERLRIAQQSAAQQRKKQHRKQTWLSSTSSADLKSDSITIPEPRPSTSHSTKRRQTGPQVDQDSVTREQAEWFATLPEKARRQHFSLEEQVRLTKRCEGAFLPPEFATVLEPTETLLRKNITQQHRCPSQHASPSNAHLEHCPDSDATSSRTAKTIDADMAIFSLYTRRRASLAPAVTSLPPPPPPPLPSRVPDKPKRKSFSRALLLTPLVLPPPTLAPIPPIPSPSTIRQRVVAARLSRPYVEPVPLASDEPSEARYYQDPDARRQLRQYLASPQKFDEAIEFGFPSSDYVPPSSSDTDCSFPIQKTPSPCGDDGDDASLDSSGPATPTEAQEDRHRTIIQSASLDSGIGLPSRLNMTGKAEDDSTFSLCGSREMTLRMTLTRPELRLSEDKLQEHRRKQTETTGVEDAGLDPLALGSLPVCDDHTGAHGAFAVQEDQQKKGFKRVWKSLRRR